MVTWSNETDYDVGKVSERRKSADCGMSSGDSNWVRQYLEWEESTDVHRSEVRPGVTTANQPEVYAMTAAHAHVA